MQDKKAKGQERRKKKKSRAPAAIMSVCVLASFLPSLLSSLIFSIFLFSNFLASFELAAVAAVRRAGGNKWCSRDGRCRGDGKCCRQKCKYMEVEVLVLVPVPAPNCSVPCSMEIVGSSPAMLSRVCLLSSLNVPEPVLSSADRGPRAPLCCLYGALAAGGPL